MGGWAHKRRSGAHKPHDSAALPPPNTSAPRFEDSLPRRRPSSVAEAMEDKSASSVESLGEGGMTTITNRQPPTANRQPLTATPQVPRDSHLGPFPRRSLKSQSRTRLPVLY